MSKHYFLLLGWDRYGFNKRRAGTCCIKLVFLHTVRSAGHIVHSGAPTAQIVGTLFFMLRWERYGFHKKHTGPLYAELVFLHPVEYAGHIGHSSATEA
jgi:hypothetical protein